jgi:HAE1 family hydrophobic/amphiphilic exporter-1
MEAAREATRDIGLAVLATTLSLVVIFVPVSFMSSISGRFLYQFGITAAVAILVSLLVSFTLTPMMSSRLLRAEARGPRERDSRGGFYARLETATRLAATAMRTARGRGGAVLVVLSSYRSTTR